MILRPCRYYPHRRVLFQPLCQSSTLSTPSTTPYELLPLPRSLPAHHALLLLHIPIPPTSWPPRLELASQLISEASKHLKHSKIAVNAIYDGSGSSTTFSAHEVYPARLLYPDGRVFTFPSFSKASLDSAELQAGLNHSAAIESLNEASIGRYAGDGEHEILVCTHGARDCRCSDRGGPLVEALRAEISRRGVEGRVRVNEIAHVGGHKFVIFTFSCLRLS